MINKEDAVAGAIVTINNKKAFSGERHLHIFSVNGTDNGSKIDNAQIQFEPGEELEIVQGPKKINNINLVKVKIVGTELVGEAYWVDFRTCCDLKTPSPNLKEKVISNSETDFKLNSNEEFVLVSKNNPKLVLRNVNYEHLGRDKDDVYEDSFIFSTKSGKRKSYKNFQSLYGFLNHNSGMVCKGKWDVFYAHQDNSFKDPKIKEQMHHLHGVFDTWLAVGGGGNPIEDWQKVELRKYNKDTKTITTQAVSFDCYEYITKFSRNIIQTRLFGEAVSNVVNQLREDGKLETHPYLFSAKFDINKYDFYAIPKEKDIGFDLSLQELGIKKKEVVHYNQNGFLALAFETEEARTNFAQHYKNKEKLVQLYHVDEILNHPEMSQEFDAKNKLKF